MPPTAKTFAAKVPTAQIQLADTIMMPPWHLLQEIITDKHTSMKLMDRLELGESQGMQKNTLLRLLMGGWVIPLATGPLQWLRAAQEVSLDTESILIPGIMTTPHWLANILCIASKAYANILPGPTARY